MDEETKKRSAVFRFGVIADFVGGRSLSWGETERLMRDKCGQRWQIPGSMRTGISESTLKEWISRYKGSGNKLESLYPRERSDRGKTRAIEKELAAGLISLRKAVLTRVIRSCLIELTQKKQKPVLIIDEASVLRLDVFTELHTITQFEGDSKPVLPIILAGQNIIDNLMFRQSRALASRIVARGHLEVLNLQDMELYLQHHLNIAGCRQNIFSEQAVTAIHQGSGGLLRRANNLARGSLMAAASEKCNVVSAEHVRIASTEII